MIVIIPMSLAISLAAISYDSAAVARRVELNTKHAHHFARAKLDCDLPPGFEDAYAQFVIAAMRGDRAALEGMMLPGSVQFASKPRGGGEWFEQGYDIDLQFLRHRFSPQVYRFAKYPQGDSCYWVRTWTTGVGFVQTKAGTWKVYNYSDRPLQ